MFSARRSFSHRLFVSASIALPLCLSACGGGSDGSYIASLPPPPASPTPTPTATPTPTSTLAADAYPLSRPGTYDLIGTVRLHPTEPGPMDAHIASPGEFGLTVSRAADQSLAYKITGPTGFLPGGLTSIDYGSSNFSGVSGTRGSYGRTLPFSADQRIATSLNFDAGYSYVSMGEWEWWFVHLDGGTAGGFGQLFFANGDRTPAAGIPASGTATYDAHTLASLSSDLTVGIPFTLTADFGARTISTRIDQDYRYNPFGDVLDYPAPGIHVGGTGPFSNSGAFDILLTGTMNYSGGYPLNTPQTPVTQQVTGNMSGAFFGPHAEQVGGVFSLQNAGGATLLQDAFVGKQH